MAKGGKKTGDFGAKRPEKRVKVYSPKLNYSYVRGPSSGWCIPKEYRDSYKEEEFLEFIPFRDTGVALLVTRINGKRYERLAVVDIFHNIHETNTRNKESIFLVSETPLRGEAGLSSALMNPVSIIDASRIIELYKAGKGLKKVQQAGISYIDRHIKCDKILEQGFIAIPDEHFYGFLAKRLEHCYATFEDYISSVTAKAPFIAKKRAMPKI